MPRELVPLTISRKFKVRDGGNGYIDSYAPISVGPPICRYYRKPESATPGYQVKPPATIQQDAYVVVSIRYADNNGVVPAVQINDVVSGVYGQNALVRRARQYSRMLQLDCEIGTVPESLSAISQGLAFPVGAFSPAALPPGQSATLLFDDEFNTGAYPKWSLGIPGAPYGGQTDPGTDAWFSAQQIDMTNGDLRVSCIPAPVPNAANLNWQSACLTTYGKFAAQPLSQDGTFQVFETYARIIDFVSGLRYAPLWMKWWDSIILEEVDVAEITTIGGVNAALHKTVGGVFSLLAQWSKGMDPTQWHVFQMVMGRSGGVATFQFFVDGALVLSTTSLSLVAAVIDQPLTLVAGYVQVIQGDTPVGLPSILQQKYVRVWQY